MHSVLTFKRGLCNRFSMRFGFHRLLSPSFGFPFFIVFPFTRLFSHLYFSCLPVFMSWHFIPSFFCAHSGPALSVYVHNYIYLNPMFQVAQGLTMRRVSLFVPAHFVPLHRNHLSRPLFMSSSFCPCCAHTCTFPLVFRLPSGRRVYVCV